MKKEGRRQNNKPFIVGGVLAIVIALTLIFANSTKVLNNLKNTFNELSPSPTSTNIVFPTVAESEITGWKLYENSYFSMKYPDNYQAKELSFSTRPEYPSALSSIGFRSNNGHLITITVAKNFKNLTIDNSLGNGPYFSYTREALVQNKIQRIVVNGKKGIIAENVNAGQTSPNIDVIFIRNENIYQIMSTPENINKDIFMTSLQTFIIKN